MPKQESNFTSGCEVSTVWYSIYHTMSSIVLFQPLLDTVPYEKTSTLLKVATATAQLQKNTTFGEKTETTNAIRGTVRGMYDHGFQSEIRQWAECLRFCLTTRTCNQASSESAELFGF
jgi:hypothetical protein